MDNHEFLEQFLSTMTPLREETIRLLLKENFTYQEICQNESAAEAVYLQLDLTEEQRNVVDAYMMHKEHGYIYYADTAYLAGIKHVLQLVQSLNVN